jgi:Ni/Fe-hydrogenase subunit HybB-like protein
MSEKAQPVGGPVFTRPVKVLFGVALLGLVITAWRFAVGLGPSTGLSDGYPWGIWIAFDVVTGTALGCGGYAVAILVYLFNKGKYHPLVRPAILTSALGYTMAAVAITIDVGRPWFIWRIPLGGFPDMGGYNWNSALLEVALCVMAYVAVLWIELSPAFFEKWKDDPDRPRLARFSRTAYNVLDKSLLWIIALGLLLPTMHQSSLGSLMLLSGPRLHPLWNVPLLPLLFLISCVTMGYGVVVFESAFASRVFGRRPETGMLRSLYGAAVLTIGLYLGIRFVELIARGRIALLWSAGMYSVMFWLENLLLVGAVVLWYRNRQRLDLPTMVRGALLMVLSGALYRFDTYLVAFQPGSNWSYFPTVPEMLVTLGIIAAEVLLYVVIVKRFPILSGAPAAAGAH